MSSPERKKLFGTLGAASALILFAAAALVSACTVKPLYSNAPLAGVDASAASVLSSIEVQPVDTRVAQQVRNPLIFFFNGGKGQPADPRYSLKLSVTARRTAAAIIQRGREDEPTAGSVQVNAIYAIADIGTGTTVATGSRNVSAGYDIPRQAFAQRRAALDAENRAARELAELLKLTILQDISRAASTGPKVTGPSATPVPVSPETIPESVDDPSDGLLNPS